MGEFPRSVEVLMARDWCLMPDQIAAFAKALHDRDLKMEDFLRAPEREDRVKMMTDIVGDPELAGKMTDEFERTELRKNNELALENAVNRMLQTGRYDPKIIAKAKSDLEAFKNSPRYQQAAERAGQAKERALNQKEIEKFLDRLANQLAGREISPDVAQRVGELMQNVRTAKANMADTDRLSGYSPEYWQARNALNAYVETQKHQSALKSTIGNLAGIARDVKLLTPATWLKVLWANTINATTEALSRRIATQTLTGAAGDIAKEANRQAAETWSKSGVNEALVENPAEVGLNTLGEKLNLNNVPNVHFAGFGGAIANVTSKIERLTHKISIDFGHNIAFTKFSQKTFFDAANIFATKFAKQFGGNAQEIMRDAVRIEPQTEAGAKVRSMAQQSAAWVTSTNKTWASTLSMGIKKVLNDISPTLQIGNFIEPMAKIPATVIANGIHNMGAGIPFGIRDIWQGRLKMASTDEMTRMEGFVQMANGMQKLTRITGTIGLAALLTSGLSKKDFRQDKYGHSFVHMWGHWINLEYVALASPAVAGMMKAKQTGDAVDYLTGGLGGIKAIPGAGELPKLLQAVGETGGKGIVRWGKDFLRGALTVPMIQALMSNRPVNELLFRAHGFESDAQVRQDELEAARKRARARAGG